MANHEIVPGSAFTKGTAERRKSATSFSLPGFACSGTYKANFVITFSCFDQGPSGINAGCRYWLRFGRSDHLSEFLKEFRRELLGRGIDQPAAKLGKLAADLRLDVIVQYRCAAVLLQPHRGAALGKSSDTPRA